MQKRGLANLSFTVLLALSGYRPAVADYYAFAGSSYDRNEYLALSFAGGGSADVYTDGFQGWVGTRATNFSTGGPDGNPSYLTGNDAEGLFNDYFVFDLSGQTSTVTSASMTVGRDTVVGNMTWSLYAPTVPPASLGDAVSPNPRLYAELVGGPLYGSVALKQADTSSLVTVQLDPAAVAAINGMIGKGEFAAGGTVNAAVPEPAGAFLIILGLLGVGIARYRRAS
ncbi:MAG: hypothetical protein JO122_11715 [Acetobacteraceae bacterium]|nr:hypothetical protein [Acetobacteraceae bacterium]